MKWTRAFGATTRWRPCCAFLRIIFGPGDETRFVAYEAATSEAVAEAGRRSGLETTTSVKEQPSPSSAAG
jgi:hypothetical protein